MLHRLGIVGVSLSRYLVIAVRQKQQRMKELLASSTAFLIGAKYDDELCAMVRKTILSHVVLRSAEIIEWTINIRISSRRPRKEVHADRRNQRLTWPSRTSREPNSPSTESPSNPRFGDITEGCVPDARLRGENARRERIPLRRTTNPRGL